MVCHRVVVQRSAPARLVRASLEHRPFDLEVAVLGVRLGDVHHQVVVEQQLGQRVGAVRAERPVRLAVQAVDGGEVGVQPGAVGAAVVLAHVEGVFQVVEIADLQIAVDLVELLHRHDDVLDLGAAEPLDADRELAGDHRLADHGEQRRPGALEQRLAVGLDDDAQDVRAGQAVLTLLFEGEPPGLERLQPGRQVDEERVRAQAGVDAQPVAAPAPLVVHAKAGRLTGRRRCTSRPAPAWRRPRPVAAPRRCRRRRAPTPPGRT